MRIPRIFHHIWFGSELPSRFKEYIKTWKRFHPGWKFMFWDEDNLPELINQRLYNKARTYAEQSDIVRLEILKKYGGVYVDTDYECFSNISPLIKDSRFFIICDRKIWKLNHPKYHIPYLNNAFMGCTPNHPSVNKLIEELPGFYKKNRSHHVCFRTGPGFVSQILYKKPDILLLDHNLTTQKYAKHHYENSWKEIEPQPQPWPED